MRGMKITAEIEEEIGRATDRIGRRLRILFETQGVDTLGVSEEEFLSKIRGFSEEQWEKAMVIEGEAFDVVTEAMLTVVSVRVARNSRDTGGQA